MPNWNDLSPRLGVAYDLFGDGKTAIKWSIGKYVIGYGNRIALANNPVTTSVLQVTRTWTDSNSNFVPDCDLTNPQQQCRVWPHFGPQLRTEQPEGDTLGSRTPDRLRQA